MPCVSPTFNHLVVFHEIWYGHYEFSDMGDAGTSEVGLILVPLDLERYPSFFKGNFFLNDKQQNGGCMKILFSSRFVGNKQ